MPARLMGPGVHLPARRLSLRVGRHRFESDFSPPGISLQQGAAPSPTNEMEDMDDCNSTVSFSPSLHQEYSKLPAKELAARFVSKFSTGFCLDEEERVLFTQTLGQCEKLGCFTAFFSCMGPDQYVEARTVFLSAAEEHVGCGLASDFVREQAEKWLLTTHADAPTGADAMQQCNFGLPLQLLISGTHQVIRMHRGGNSAQHLEYDLTAVRLVLLHIFVESVWRVWRGWALNIIQNSSHTGSRSPRGTTWKVAGSRDGVQVHGEESAVAAEDEFDEMKRKLEMWREENLRHGALNGGQVVFGDTEQRVVTPRGRASKFQTATAEDQVGIQLTGKRALRHVLKEVRARGFGDPAAFYIFCDRQARQFVALTELQRALKELEIVGVDASSLLQLSKNVHSRNGMEHELQLTDIDFVRLFSWEGFFYSDASGVFLGGIPAFQALAEVRRNRGEITDRMLANMAVIDGTSEHQHKTSRFYQTPQRATAASKSQIQGRRPGYARAWSARPLSSTRNSLVRAHRKTPSQATDSSQDVLIYSPSSTKWWGPDGTYSTIYTTKYGATPKSAIAISLNLSGGRGSRQSISPRLATPHRPENNNLPHTGGADREREAKEAFLRPTSPLHVAHTYHFHPSATHNKAARSRATSPASSATHTAASSSFIFDASPSHGNANNFSAPSGGRRDMTGTSSHGPMKSVGSPLISPREVLPASHSSSPYISPRVLRAYASPRLPSLRLTPREKAAVLYRLQGMHIMVGDAGATITRPTERLDCWDNCVQSHYTQRFSAANNESPRSSNLGVSHGATGGTGMSTEISWTIEEIPPFHDTFEFPRSCKANIFKSPRGGRRDLTGGSGSHGPSPLISPRTPRSFMGMAVQSICQFCGQRHVMVAPVLLRNAINHIFEKGYGRGGAMPELSKVAEEADTSLLDLTAFMEEALGCAAVDGVDVVVQRKGGDGGGEDMGEAVNSKTLAFDADAQALVVEIAVQQTLQDLLSNLTVAGGKTEVMVEHDDENNGEQVVVEEDTDTAPTPGAADDDAQDAAAVTRLVPTGTKPSLKQRPQSARPDVGGGGGGAPPNPTAPSRKHRPQSAVVARLILGGVVGAAMEEEDTEELGIAYLSTPGRNDGENALATVRDLMFGILQKDFGRRMMWTKGRARLPLELLREVREQIKSVRKAAVKAIYSPAFTPQDVSRLQSAREQRSRPPSGGVRRPMSSRVCSGGDGGVWDAGENDRAGGAMGRGDWDYVERAVYSGFDGKVVKGVRPMSARTNGTTSSWMSSVSIVSSRVYYTQSRIKGQGERLATPLLCGPAYIQGFKGAWGSPGCTGVGRIKQSGRRTSRVQQSTREGGGGVMVGGGGDGKEPIVPKLMLQLPPSRSNVHYFVTETDRDTKKWGGVGLEGVTERMGRVGELTGRTMLGYAEGVNRARGLVAKRDVIREYARYC